MNPTTKTGQQLRLLQNSNMLHLHPPEVGHTDSGTMMIEYLMYPRSYRNLSIHVHQHKVIHITIATLFRRKWLPYYLIFLYEMTDVYQKFMEMINFSRGI